MITGTFSSTLCNLLTQKIKQTSSVKQFAKIKASQWLDRLYVYWKFVICTVWYFRFSLYAICDLLLKLLNVRYTTNGQAVSAKHVVKGSDANLVRELSGRLLLEKCLINHLCCELAIASLSTKFVIFSTSSKVCRLEGSDFMFLFWSYGNRESFM